MPWVWSEFGIAESDPRFFQVTSLGGLLAAGYFFLGFELQLVTIVAGVASCLVTQRFWTWTLGRPGLDLLSPLITALSLAIILRVPHPSWMMLAAIAAITSKFLMRFYDRHIFNPANFGICITLFLGGGWVSPAQWGSDIFTCFLFVCLAGLVLTRSKRADTALAFLTIFATILFVRAAYLGDPWAIPFQQLQSGALLLFAFFMITDPKTTPVFRSARLIYAALVAAVAAYLQFAWFIPEAIMLALLMTSLVVPLINRLSGDAGRTTYDWSKPTI